MNDSNKLKKVVDFAVILNLITSAKAKNAEVYVWKVIGDKKHLSQVRLESIRKTRKDFAIVPTEGQEQNLQDIIGTSNTVDIFIPDSTLIFRSVIRISESPSRYYLEIPEFVAQVERRKNLRLVLEDASEFKISFSTTTNGPRPIAQYFHKGCYDVSTGGLSFYISRLELKFFQEQGTIDLVIKIDKVMLKAKALLTNIREIDPDEFNGLSYKVWKVGCRFIEIDQLARKYIENFIFERIKKELHVINE